MKILAIDCSATPASAAVLEDGVVRSFAYTNIGLTHSQTLIPMVNSILSNAGYTLEQMGQFAINAGPGSFTGVRIGVAALKGLTLFRGDCIFPVSTLESMAYLYSGVKDCIVCGAMDARRKQVYTACFEIAGSAVTRLTEDSAISIEQLGEQLLQYSKPIVLVGDGAELCYNSLREKLENLELAPQPLRFQNAVGVGLCAEAKAAAGAAPVSSDQLLPVYLRAPQAERELKRKQQSKNQ